MMFASLCPIDKGGKWLFKGRSEKKLKKIWRAGELESWRAGELESWRAGELESWRAGELESWLIVSSREQVSSTNFKLAEFLHTIFMR
ncbi:hypothetical protein OPW36_02740 [Vibrio europaeus]|uniref:hypothetical protein n=1 Tax=Vibrio europaeus TaxID=300876 RepID=UPI00233EEC4C|nr:hypothetical protein [Vibrio europaeus]MDC5810335.1 hypothetical protein [Vibrio europaeus]MDC5823635.1 hypothetical protein [Vibrio europaeus]MDC5841331.1 hypothetical protein [Vibrio europaeus]MDC5847876.1 hypothetical protein [Vibrio europaeus]MDC5854514.1 hypothetical protein [Vibrio europaeus]